ncbi:MAG: alanine racemase [Parachlamydiaceae bacterium]|nr:alanine racemase [Parachlamydiaceae bacterium]
MDSFDLNFWNGFIDAGGDSSSPAFIDSITIDSRRIGTQHPLFVALQGVQDGHLFIEHARQQGAKYAIVSKYWKPPKDLVGIILLSVDSPLAALQSLAKSYRFTQKAKVICIAGTYGKTMVKDLLLRMLDQQMEVTASPGSFNSQIGVPLSLFTINHKHEVALIEASISKKGEMDLLAEMIAPDAVILTPLGKKHITTLKDIKTIEQETLRFLNYTKPNGWVLLPKVLKFEKTIHAFHYWDEKSNALPHANLLTHPKETQQESLAEISYALGFPDGKKIFGTISSGHYYFINLINCASKAAWLLGATSESISNAIQGYLPEPMRTEIWKSQQGAVFINESYCGDPQSIDQALKKYKQSPGSRKIFLFGGLRETKNDKGKYLSDQSTRNIDYKRVGMALKNQQITQFILVGQQSFDALTEEVSSHSPEIDIVHFNTYEEAFSWLRPNLKQNDSILITGKSKIPLESLMQSFNDSLTTNQCIINLDAIESNIARLRNKLPTGTRLMIMVKAFAYGTGELQLAKFLGQRDIDILGVSNVDEAVALKNEGVSQAIFVIHAALYEASKVAKWGFEVGVSDELMIQKLNEEARKLGREIKVHLHIDTGMGRFGCRPEDSMRLGRIIAASSNLEFEGIMTHFPSADIPVDDSFTLQQSKRLDDIVEGLCDEGIVIKWRHASNSSAAIRFEFPQYNMVRIGLALYGLRSSEALQPIDLRLALSLTTRIVGINVCKRGDTISYGRSYIVEQEEQRIAILPLGYFDGLHRNYSNKGYVIIRGMKAPMVGKICMDFMMVDVTHIPYASVGDPVLIFGEDEYGQYLPAEEFARNGNSIVHELITCLGPRIQRVFIHEEKDSLKQ